MFFELQDVPLHLAKLAIAYLLSFPIAWDRERSERTAGLRTFTLVAVASCGYMMIAVKILGPDIAAHSRVLPGLMMGIGFIGSGAILKSRGSVHGTATAASIWNTGAMGAAVAYGQYDIAVVLSVVNFGTLRWLRLHPSNGTAERQE